jgi:hypothetical protein
MIPLAGLQTFPLSLSSTTYLGAVLLRFVPEPPWIRPPTGCSGNPVGTPDERRLELGARLFETLMLFAGTFIAILVVTTIFCGSAVHRGRRRELELLTITAWTAIASVTAGALFLAHCLINA